MWCWWKCLICGMWMSIRLWYFWVRRWVIWIEILWIVYFKLFKFWVLVDNDFKGIVFFVVFFSENDVIIFFYNNRVIGIGRNNFLFWLLLMIFLVFVGFEVILCFIFWNFNLMFYLFSKVFLGSVFFFL